MEPRPPFELAFSVDELFGLEHIAVPGEARAAIKQGSIVALPSSKIKHNLSVFAVTICQHLQLAGRYQNKIDHGKEAIRFLVCAVQGLQVPSTQQHITLKLDNSTQSPLLSLCHWEGLYYAVVGKIRELHQDILQNFTSELEAGEFVMHTCGQYGASPGTNFTARNFAGMLEDMHSILMDQRLIGPLEIAVRKEKLADQYRDQYGNRGSRERFEAELNRLNEQEADAHLDRVQGMVLISLLSPDTLLDKIFNECIPLVRRACQERFHVELVLPQRQVDGMATITNQNVSTETISEPHCFCSHECSCRLVCQFEVHPCTCKAASNHHLEFDEANYQRNEGHSGGQDDTMMRTASRSTTSSRRYHPTGMQIVPQHQSRDPYAMIASRARAGSNNAMASEMQQLPRPRADTSDSDLAYVPRPRTPSQGRPMKDSMPLALYGSDSPQRYPKFEQAKTSQQHGHSFYSGNFPVRKPLPSTSFETAVSSSSPEMTDPPSSPPDMPYFIAPRPARVQRYVSAGGDAKLADRAEILGYSLPATVEKGVSMTREELERKLPVVTRISRDAEELGDGEKRDRAGSSSSLRAVKRIFSRQGSQSETDR